jgi:hypothetical protein
MKSLYTLGVAAGLAVFAAGFTSPVSAAPVSPIAIKQALGEAPSDVIDVRHGGGGWGGGGGGMRWRGGGHWGGGGGRWAHGGGWNRGWHGGGWNRGWHGNRWYGGRRWYGGNGWYGGGWGWGFPLVVAPYAYNNGYYNDDCGYVTVRRWVNGRRIWVRRYQCW